MKKSFIQKLYESEIQNTELALAVESISSDLQSMVEKLSNIKVKDIAELTKKLKFDGDIDAGEQLNQSIGGKIDQAIQSLSDIKSEIDNEVVRISQGDMSSTNDGLNDTGDDFDFEGSDLESDFGEFSDDEELDDDADLDLAQLDREMK